MKENNSESILKRAVIVIFRQAVGRAGKLTSCAWDSCNWTLDAMLCSDWRQFKTSLKFPCPFPPDRLSCLLDVNHALAYYIMTSTSSSFRVTHPDSTYDKVCWMFLMFQTMARGGVATKVSKIITEMRGKVDGLMDGQTSHGLRAGALHEMLNNPTYTLAAVVRCGTFASTDY